MVYKSTSRGLQTGPVFGHPVVLTAQAYYFHHHITSLDFGERLDMMTSILFYNSVVM